MDPEITSAQNLVLQAVAAHDEADEQLTDAMWAAKQAGASSNDIARWVKGTWSRPTVLDLIPVAGWRAGVRQALTEAGLTVGSRDRPDSAEADVRISLPDLRSRWLVADLGWAPQDITTPSKLPSIRLADAEPLAERAEQVRENQRTQWLQAIHHRATVAVPALLTAGYRLFEPPPLPTEGTRLLLEHAPDREFTDEAEAIAYLTAGVLVAVIIEPANTT